MDKANRYTQKRHELFEGKAKYLLLGRPVFFRDNSQGKISPVVAYPPLLVFELPVHFTHVVFTPIDPLLSCSPCNLPSSLSVKENGALVYLSVFPWQKFSLLGRGEVLADSVPPKYLAEEKMRSPYEVKAVRCVGAFVKEGVSSGGGQVRVPASRCRVRG